MWDGKASFVFVGTIGEQAIHFFLPDSQSRRDQVKDLKTKLGELVVLVNKEFITEQGELRTFYSFEVIP